MTPSRVGRLVQVLTLALLLVALGTGVPIHGEAHHAGDHDHIGPPEHSHGLALVQHDMRLERTAPPIFAAVESEPIAVQTPAPKTIEDLTPRDGRLCESRAPPESRPRAPPTHL